MSFLKRIKTFSEQLLTLASKSKVNDGDYELYNMAEDATELNNLAEQFPNKRKDLVERYKQVKTSLP